MKLNRDNATGRWVSRHFAKLNPATTSEATIHRAVVTDEMIEAAEDVLYDRLGIEAEPDEDYRIAAIRDAIAAALAARKDAS